MGDTQEEREDSDLGSMNHHLDGVNKVWFLMSNQRSRDEFVDGLRKMYPTKYKMCSQTQVYVS